MKTRMEKLTLEITLRHLVDYANKAAGKDSIDAINTAESMIKFYRLDYGIKLELIAPDCYVYRLYCTKAKDSLLDRHIQEINSRS